MRRKIAEGLTQASAGELIDGEEAELRLRARIDNRRKGTSGPGD